MNVAESGLKWITAVLMAPFVAIMFGAIGMMMRQIYRATRISGGGEFAQAQESVYSGSMVALNLIEFASSIETWILFGAFLLAIYATVSSVGQRGF